MKRKGVDVRARKGYWAYTAEDVDREQRGGDGLRRHRRSPTALDRSRRPGTGQAPRISGSARHAGRTARRGVTFSWEPAPRVPAARRGTSGARRVDAARWATGRSAAAERLSWPRALDGALGPAVAPAQGVAPVKLVFDVPPGQLELQDGGRRHARAGDRYSRPRSDGSGFQHRHQVSFGTPRVYQRPHDTGTAGAQRRNRMRFRPPSVSSAEPNACYIRVEAYAPGGVAPPVTARLLNRAGQTMADVPVQQAAGTSRGNRSCAVDTAFAARGST